MLKRTNQLAPGDVIVLDDGEVTVKATSSSGPLMWVEIEEDPIPVILNSFDEWEVKS